MNTHTKIALWLLLLGITGIFAGKALWDSFERQQSIHLSDATRMKGRIVIGVDNWVGYFPLCSPVLQRRLYQQGYSLECQDDGADYPRRFTALAQGKIDLAAASLDAYLVNGAASKYPGAVIAVLDESRGGDALVAWQDRLASLEALRQREAVKIAFTPDSPSDHLLKAVAVHFDILWLKRRRDWPVFAKGSSDALRRLLAREVEAAVLWEPDIARARQESGITVLLSTAQTRQLIVDTLIAGRAMIRERPEALKTLLSEYFWTLKHYRDHPEALTEDLRQATALPDSAIQALLQGVAWQGMTENARQWLGLSAPPGELPRQDLVETLQSSVHILLQYGAFDHSPLPDNDPYRLLNSRFIGELYQQWDAEPAAVVEQVEFPALNEQQWRNLQPVGLLKIRPIVFASGTDQLTLDDKKQLDEAAETLKHYPRFRVLIRGHTSTRGDAQQNKQLSLDRAQAVMRYLIITHSIPETRLYAVGLGGDEPLSRLPDESDRAYFYRLPRVELLLVTERW